VGDTVFEVHLADAGKAMACIKALQVCLRADPYRHARIEQPTVRQCAAHQLMPEAATTEVCIHHNPSNRGLRALETRRQAARIRHKTRLCQTQAAEQVLRAGVEPVEVLVHALLFHAEDRDTQAQQVVQLRRTQRFEFVAVPGKVHRVYARRMLDSGIAGQGRCAQR